MKTRDVERMAEAMQAEETVVSVRSLYGFMRGSVILPADIDLTEPFLDEPCIAEKGKLHG